MAAASHDAKHRLIARVPGLERSIFELTSPRTEEYNCIAWAAHDTEHWWWPGGGFWPRGAAERETLAAFEAAFATRGFTRCESPALEAGYEKVALYAIDGVPTHAARQLADGSWTSKLGALEDVRHPLEAFTVIDYGQPVRF